MSATSVVAQDFKVADLDLAELFRGHDQGAAEQLLALYVLKAGQPEQRRVSLAGALAVDPYLDDRATAYFRVGPDRDRGHAGAARKALAGVLIDRDPPRLLERLEALCRARWQMLDAIESYCTESQCDRASVRCSRAVVDPVD